MLLKSIALRNIRSYTDEVIEFPEGIVLLSGDIGCGKSTILLSVEFALFGLLKGDLGGGALLRNGCNVGSVCLVFELEGVLYTIMRSLRRSGVGIKQDVCSLEVGGVVQKLTPLELKSRMLDLIGYPAELLTKSKSLIYRYTVYTPQEDMKRILDEDQEDRLRILRSVFDIEKYQRIKGNASFYAKNLRERIRHMEGQLVDLEVKRQRRREMENDQSSLKSELSRLRPEFERAKKAVVETRCKLKDLEDAKVAFDRLKNDVDVNSARKDALLRRLDGLRADIADVSEKIVQLEREVRPLEDVRDEFEVKQSRIKKLESDLLQHERRHAEFDVQRKHAQSVAARISQLSECPTCFQVVGADHKSKILSEQKQVLKSVSDQEAEFKRHVGESRSALDALKQDLELLREKEKECAVNRVKHCNLKEYKSKRERFATELESFENEVQRHERIIIELVAGMNGLSPMLGEYAPVKERLDLALRAERDIAVEHARVVEKMSFIDRQLRILVDDINQKELVRLKLEKIKETNAWLDDAFVPLMGEIERHVMAKIQEEFNDTFKTWFGMLIEDSLMTAELDDTFTPVILQNGYETSSAFLSGGEKTACALAYRLALNRTINSLLSSVKTKDVLILDEPTDGFSDEQLDKMRDVLEDLSLRQIILVSHERKIESFADSVIRIDKRDHVSRLASSSAFE